MLRTSRSAVANNRTRNLSCTDHWHCDPSKAAHACDKPDRTTPCPTCGEAPGLTGATISDEQIRELLEASRHAGPDDTAYLYCRVALGTMSGDQAKARARCADLFNARVAAVEPVPPLTDLMLTAETITDDQIREFWQSTQRELDALTTTMTTYDRHAKMAAMVYSARVALGEKRARRGDSRAKARARCAEHWNARAVTKRF